MVLAAQIATRFKQIADFAIRLTALAICFGDLLSLVRHFEKVVMSDET